MIAVLLKDRKSLFSSLEKKSQLTEVKLYAIETLNRNRSMLHAVSFYLYSQTLGQYDRDLTKEVIEKSKSETIVMQDEDSFTKLFEFSRKY